MHLTTVWRMLYSDAHFDLVVSDQYILRKVRNDLHSNGPIGEINLLPRQ